MIKNFFQSLEDKQVAYLLISGQAAVLYGASAFSEDIDLWVRPEKDNIQGFLAALESIHASYYKLTPPLTPAFMKEGHGFHYILPDTPEMFLDVMGNPPRVPSFEKAREDSRMIFTSWGTIPTIGIRHLTAIKATQRLADYQVISQLAFRFLEEQPEASLNDLQWAVEHIHTLNDLLTLFAHYPASREICSEHSHLQNMAEAFCKSPDSPDRAVCNATEAWLAQRMLKLQQADRAYWHEIIAKLRILKSENKLMPIGKPVTSLQ